MRLLRKDKKPCWLEIEPLQPSEIQELARLLSGSTQVMSAQADFLIGLGKVYTSGGDKHP